MFLYPDPTARRFQAVQQQGRCSCTVIRFSCRTGHRICSGDRAGLARLGVVSPAATASHRLDELMGERDSLACRLLPSSTPCRGESGTQEEDTSQNKIDPSRLQGVREQACSGEERPDRSRRETQDLAGAFSLVL